MGMPPVFGKIDKRGNEFIECKGGGSNDHDLTGFLHPIPVDHLKYDADKGQVHQQDQKTAEAVGSPLLLHRSRLFPAQDLKQLDQSLSKVVNAV